MRTLVLWGALAPLAAACAPPAVTSPGPAAPVVEYVTHQEILTPLPLRVSLPSRLGANRVLVFVHTWGSRGWSVAELDREGQTWSGEISCRDVSTVTGDTRYFFLALDPNGDAVVGSGSPGWPHIATIVGKLEGGPRALPGDALPVRCHDPADCPPDFPGCPAYAFRRPACHSSMDCADGTICAWDGYCGSPTLDIDPETSDEDALAAAVRRATGKRRLSASR
jgi:hypothetical protein